jgi:hypothetical protein
VRPFRWVPPFFAAATLLLLLANALPASVRKKRLLVERERVERLFLEERERASRLDAEIRALAEDPFVLERWTLETWERTPKDLLPWPPPPPRSPPTE